jgi:hypothetical protein
VKRTSILLAAVLALVLAACGSDQTAESPSPTPEPTATVEPTPVATPSPTEATETDDGGGSGATGDLAAALPETVGGLERQEMPAGMEDIFASALAQQGIDAEEADFAWAMYGTAGELVAMGFRMPGLNEAQLEQLAQMMSGMQVEGAEDLETETASIGGKEVLRTTTAGETQRVYMYISGDTFFTVVTESEDLAAELLSQLP